MKKRNYFIIAIIALIGVAFIFNACKKDPDATKPVITLKGDAETFIVFKATWTDPGYSATDDIDGDITSNVTISGTVNNISAGVYTLTYNVKDAAGNSADPKTRKVTVDAAAFLAGSYTVTDVSNGYTSTYPDNVTASTTQKNKISFAKFGNYSNALVSALLSGTSVEVPQITVKCGTPPNDVDHTFQGTGTFNTSSKINITYSDNSVYGNFTGCTGTYTKL